MAEQLKNEAAAERAASHAPPQKGGYIAQAWLVVLLALVFGVSLAMVHTALAERIEQNKIDEAVDAIVGRGDKPALLSEATDAEQVQVALGKQEKAVFRALGENGRLVGWAIPAQGQGFGDVIELIVAVDPMVETIEGIYVISQKETPALGEYITSGPKFRDQFEGKEVRPPLEVVKEEPEEPNEVQALTGATISSQSVTDIVNGAVAQWREVLRARATASAQAE
jgi:electron transport complex protein RnfG